MAYEERGEVLEKSSNCEQQEIKDFGWALRKLKAGFNVFRRGWNGKGLWLNIQRPDANSKMSRPYIYMHTADNGLVPWTASQSDILETDWDVLKV